MNKIVYAITVFDKEILKRSSSGGAFYLLSKYVVENGGVVYGASFNKNNLVEHVRVDSVLALTSLMGSKYVQSDMGNSLILAKRDLLENRLVLFSGTPCQIKAVHCFLSAFDKGNLILVDTICHGVPSKTIWESYISEKKISDNSDISFRDKTSGWENFSLRINNNYCLFSNDIYMRAFLDNYSLNEPCYKCLYKADNRVSDFTLGDFWGVSDVFPELYNPNGVSLIIVHKKHDFLMNILKKGDCVFNVVDFEKALSHNSAYAQSVAKPINRDRFIKAIKKGMTFSKAFKKYCHITIIEKIRYKFDKIFKHVKT